MHRIAVGEPLNPDRTIWPEKPEYNYDQRGHTLLLPYSDPTAQEVTAVRDGRKEFAFAYKEGVIFFLFRYGNAPWSDATYTVHLVPDPLRKLPEARRTVDERALLNTILIDRRSGIVRALNACTFSPSFTHKLEAAIRGQAGLPWDGIREHIRAGMRIYDQYPTSRDLLADAAARTVGGA